MSATTGGAGGTIGQKQAPTWDEVKVHHLPPIMNLKANSSVEETVETVVERFQFIWHCRIRS